MKSSEAIFEAHLELNSAIENYETLCVIYKPSSYKGLSFAMEESEDDSKKEAKKTMFQRFKALLKRIKDWFVGLFRKKVDTAKNLSGKTAEVKKAAQESEFDDAIKRFNEEMDRKMQEMRKQREASRTDWKEAAERNKKEQEKNDKLREEAEKENKQANERERKAEEDEKTMLDMQKRANAMFDKNKYDYVKMCEELVEQKLRGFFKTQIPNVMRVIMCDAYNKKDPLQIGKDIAEHFDNMRYAIARYSDTLKKIGKEGINSVKDRKFDNEQNMVPMDTFNAWVKDIVDDEWMKNIDKHDRKELIKAYNRYLGFAVAIVTIIQSVEIHRIEDTLSKSVSTAEEIIKNYEDNDTVDLTGVRNLQSFYTTCIAPYAAGFSKILNIYIEAVDSIVKTPHIAKQLMSACAAKIRGEMGKYGDYLNARATIGVVLNEITKP